MINKQISKTHWTLYKHDPILKT